MSSRTTLNARQLPPVQLPKTVGGVLYFLVLVATLVGLGFVLFASWRRGVTIIGIALVAAAASRLVLGEYDAGMLRVRRRWFDVLALAVVGGLLIFLAATIPDQPLR